MKILFVSHNHPEIRPGGAEGYALDVYEGVREAGEFEPVLAVTQRSADLDRHAVPRGAPDHARQRRPAPVLLLHGHVGLGLGLRALSQEAGPDAVLSRVPARAEARRRALPAHDVHGLRHPPRDAQHAARRADRLHAARVPADLPPRRSDGAHHGRLAVRPRLAAALSRVLPAHPAADVLHAQALHPVAAVGRRPVRHAAAGRARAVRALGHPARADRARAARLRAGAAPAGAQAAERDATGSASSASSPQFKGADVLLEAMASLARGTTRTSTGTCGSTARTSTRRRRSSRTGFGSCSRTPATGCGWSASTTAPTSPS